MISVEKAKSESESASRRQPARPERRPSKERKDDAKENEVCYNFMYRRIFPIVTANYVPSSNQ